jgi:hypothetical protein
MPYVEVAFLAFVSHLVVTERGSASALLVRFNCIRGAVAKLLAHACTAWWSDPGSAGFNDQCGGNGSALGGEDVVGAASRCRAHVFQADAGFQQGAVEGGMGKAVSGACAQNDEGRAVNEQRFEVLAGQCVKTAGFPRKEAFGQEQEAFGVAFPVDVDKAIALGRDQVDAGRGG